MNPLLLALACTGDGDRPPFVDTGDRPPPTSCPEAPCIPKLATAEIAGDSYFGAELVAAGDDLYIGAPGYVDAGTTGPTVRRLSISAQTELGRWTGEPLDRSGEDLAIGDVDGDGIAEVAVARPGVNSHANGAMVHLLPAITGDDSFEQGALLTVVGDGQGGGSGSVLLARVALADGGAELVVTGRRRDGSDPRLHAFSTALRGTVGEDAARATITSPLGLGNVAAWDGDADGRDDLVVQQVEGVFYFRSGWQDGTLDQRDADWTDPCASACDIGLALSVVGDVTGDGASDLAFSAPTFEEPAYRAGRAYVVDDADAPGPAAAIPRQVQGRSEGEGMGFALAGGDLDGDGQTDLVVSASRVFPSDDPGVLLVFRGPLPEGTLTAEDADARVSGEFGHDLFVRSIAPVDLDGDAQQDLAVGAPGHPAGAGDGVVYLVAGNVLFPGP